MALFGYLNTNIHRAVRRHPLLHPQAGQSAGLRDRHIERRGGAGTGQADAVGQWVFGPAGACRQHKGIGDTPLCQAAGKAGSGGTGGSYTGHDFDWNTGVTRGIHFLGSASKHPGISGFQPHNATALLRLGDDHAVNPILRPAVGTDVFADGHALSVTAGQFQNLCIDQPVVKDHIRFLKPFDRAQGQQVARAGASADQGDLADIVPGGAAAGNGSFDVTRGVAFGPAHPLSAWGLLEDPSPEGAALCHGNIACDTGSEPPGKGSEATNVLRQKPFNLGLDFAR